MLHLHTCLYIICTHTHTHTHTTHTHDTHTHTHDTLAHTHMHTHTHTTHIHTHTHTLHYIHQHGVSPPPLALSCLLPHMYVHCQWCRCLLYLHIGEYSIFPMPHAFLPLLLTASLPSTPSPPPSPPHPSSPPCPQIKGTYSTKGENTFNPYHRGNVFKNFAVALCGPFTPRSGGGHVQVM